MLILNCSKAAAEFFSTSKKGVKHTAIEPAPKQTIADDVTSTDSPTHWQWLLHAVKVKGKTVLIAMDYETRFSITLSGLKKGDDPAYLTTLEHHLIVHLHELMTAAGIGPEAIDASIERYEQRHCHRAFYLRGDRSVQAHINDVAWHFRRWVEDIGNVPTDAELIGQDVFVNHLIRKRKADKSYFFPQREFLRNWLNRYGDYSTSQTEGLIDNLKSNERAEFAARHPELVPPSELSELSRPPKAPAGTSNNVISLDAYRNK